MDTELPPPLSVTLHHVCLMSTRNHMMLSCTHRCRSKFVTLIIHKAWHASANSTIHHHVEHVQSGYSALHTCVAEGRNHCMPSPSSRGPSVWWSDSSMSGQQHADGPCVAAKSVQSAVRNAQGVFTLDQRQPDQALACPTALLPSASTRTLCSWARVM